MALYLGSTALTLPGVSRAYVGAEQVYPALWTPDLLVSASIDLWLGAFSGVTQSAGAMTEWADLGGSGNVARQATAARQLLYTASNPDFYNLPTVSTQDAGDGMVLDTPVGVGEWLVADAGGGQVAYGLASIYAGTFTPPANVMHAVIYPGTGLTADTDIHWVDGVLQETVLDGGDGTDPTTPGALFFVGRVRSVGFGTTFGRFLEPGGGVFNRASDWARTADLAAYELLALSGALVPEERLLMEGYLMHNANRQDELPLAHPFRTSPPLASDAYVPVVTYGDIVFESGLVSQVDASAHTVTKPSGTVEGDLMLIILGQYTPNEADLTPSGVPSGWALARAETQGGYGDSQGLLAYFKIAGASEPANYTFNFPLSTYSVAHALRYSGVDLVAPVGASSGDAGTGATRSAPGVTTTIDGSRLVMASQGFGYASTGAPSGMTVRTDISSLQTVYDEVIAAAGATGDRSHGQAGSGSDRWNTILLVLNPAEA